MTTTALVMAGGRGSRMRASGVGRPKPLVPVRGVPLLEWNVRALLHHGLLDVVVAVAPDDDEVGDVVHQRMEPLVAAAGGRVRLLVEPRPLGNIGAAGLLHGEADELVVVYADNLTTLDLRAVLEHHRRAGAALTLATHDQPFPVPYGQVRVEDGAVTAYLEKPVLHVTVCSAVSVLGPAATASCPDDRPTGLVDLTTRLLAAGSPVASYAHHAPWVDVNDATDVVRAEQLLDRLAGSLTGEAFRV